MKLYKSSQLLCSLQCKSSLQALGALHKTLFTPDKWGSLSLVTNEPINITAWKPMFLCSPYKSQVWLNTANNQLLKCVRFQNNEIISIPGNTSVLSIPSSNLFFPHLCCQLILPEDLQRKEGVWFPFTIQKHVLPHLSNMNTALQFTARSFCQVQGRHKQLIPQQDLCCN